jgi:hypothetical protein
MAEVFLFIPFQTNLELRNTLSVERFLRQPRNRELPLKIHRTNQLKMVSPHVCFWQFVLGCEHGYTNIVNNRDCSASAWRRRVLVRQTSVSPHIQKENEKTKPFPIPDQAQNCGDAKPQPDERQKQTPCIQRKTSTRECQNRHLKHAFLGLSCGLGSASFYCGRF